MTVDEHGFAGLPEPSLDAEGLGDLLGDELTTQMYLHLLRHGMAIETDLVDRGFRVQDVRLAMSVFEKRRLVRRVEAGRWEANAPEPALSSYAQRLEDRARSVRSATAGLARLYQASLSTDPALPPFQGVELLSSTREMSRAMDQLYAGATRQVVTMRTTSPQVLASLEQPADSHSETILNDRGQPITQRLSLDAALLEHEHTRPAVQARLDQGDQVRFATWVPFTASVSDAGTAMVDIDDPTGHAQPFGLLIHQPGISAPIRRVIERTWQIGIPWRGTAALSRPGASALDNKDRDILTLLTTGAADATIARQLGISSRTVERRVRRMLELLHATTRFQAGVQAVKRGWM